MGCWYETCALTNLPIIDTDQKVVCVLLPANWSEDLNMSAMRFDDCKLARGTMDDYGSMAVIDEQTHKSKFNSELHTNGNSSLIFFTAKAWDAVVKYMKSKPDTVEDVENVWKRRTALTALEDLAAGREVGTNSIHPLLKEWVYIIFFMHRTRKTYMNLNIYSGCQHVALEEHDVLKRITSAGLKAVGKKLVSWEMD